MSECSFLPRFSSGVKTSESLFSFGVSEDCWFQRRLQSLAKEKSAVFADGENSVFAEDELAEDELAEDELAEDELAEDELAEDELLKLSLSFPQTEWLPFLLTLPTFISKSPEGTAFVL